MDMQDIQKRLTQTLTLCLVSMVIAVITNMIPAFYLVGMIVLPLPFAIGYLKYGNIHALASLIVAGSTVGLVMDSLPSVFLVMTFGFAGILLGFSIKNKLSIVTTISAMAMFMLGFTIYVFNLTSNLAGQNMINVITQEITTAFERIKGIYPSGFGIEKMLTTDFVTFLVGVLPSLIFVSALVLSYVIYLVAVKFLKKSEVEILKPERLSQWYTHSQITIVMVIALIVSYLMSSQISGDIYIYNTFIIFTFVYTINGLAYISYFIEKFKIPSIIRYIILIFTVISPISNFLFFVGITDYMVDFRRLSPRKRALKK